MWINLNGRKNTSEEVGKMAKYRSQSREEQDQGRRPRQNGLHGQQEHTVHKHVGTRVQLKAHGSQTKRLLSTLHVTWVTNPGDALTRPRRLQLLRKIETSGRTAHFRMQSVRTSLCTRVIRRRETHLGTIDTPARPNVHYDKVELRAPTFTKTAAAGGWASN